MATVILLAGVPQKAKSEEVKTLNNDNGPFTTNNRITPGDSQDDIRVRVEQEAAKEKQKREVISREGRAYDKNNGYVPGQCTWYVKNKSPLARNGWGDAKYWPTNSQTPQTGAIVKTAESWRGHVAIVKEVRARTIVVEEMNYVRPYAVSTREIPKSAWFIRGYII